MDIYGLGGLGRPREATGGTHNLVLVVQSFPIVWVTGRPLQMYASLVVLCKVCRSLVVLSKCLAKFGSPVVLCNCMGHRSSFPNVWVTGRPFQMCGLSVVHSKCMGLQSPFPSVWFTGRPFQLYASSVAVSKCTGHQSSFPSVWVTGRLFQM